MGQVRTSTRLWNIKNERNEENVKLRLSKESHHKSKKTMNDSNQKKDKN